MKINEVIIKPVITEKATNQTKGEVYTFEVGKHVNKHQVKETLEKMYKVKVGEMRILVRKGKERKVGRRMKHKKLPDRKIVYVSLREGKIDIFPKA